VALIKQRNQIVLHQSQHLVTLLLTLALVLSGCSDHRKTVDCKRMNEELEKIAQQGVQMMSGTTTDFTTKQGLLAHLNEIAEGHEQESNLIDSISVQDEKLKEVKSQMINSNRRVSQIYRDRAQAVAQSSLPEKLDRQSLVSVMQPLNESLKQPIPNSNFDAAFKEMSEYCGLKQS
jgi:hypothetical protein